MNPLWGTHRGRIVGLVAGSVFGFIYLIVGFWKTLVFSIFVLVGYSVGQWVDSQGDWQEVLGDIVPPKWFRK